MAIDKDTKKMNWDWNEKQKEIHKNYSEGFLAFRIVVAQIILLLVLSIIL